MFNQYADHITYHYLVEAGVDSPNAQEILMLNNYVLNTGIMLSGGNQDNRVDITSVLLTPSMDGGDIRTQKLYVDSMTQVDGFGRITQQITYNNYTSLSPALNIAPSGNISQVLQNISSLNTLNLYRNAGALFICTGGPQGPRLYAFELTLFLQPYLSESFVIQFSPFSFPGWKHMRRAFPAYISNSDVLMIIQCQDGRLYGTYTLPSTQGRYRILPQMLDHGIKDLAFSIELDGQGGNFALFPSDFVIEVKQWEEETYIDLAVFKA
jgi:hypothetical protein